MNSSAFESVLKRDRMIVTAALIALTALAWLYVLWLARNMSMPASMLGMENMPGMAMQAIKPWTGADLLFTFAMWAAMMVGMMTPSAAPMILIYAQVGRQAHAKGKPFAATGWFAGGYLLAWTGFALLATFAQAELSRQAFLTPMLASANNVFAGIVLVAAGLFQWTSVKDACLATCQSPMHFLRRHGGFRRDPRGSLLLGLRHGAYCIGCCWALMTLLFVGGVMNVLWIASLSIVVLLEKVLSFGWLIARGVGLVLMASGIIFLAGTL